LVKNTGTITAEGGTIALTAAAGRQIVDSLVQIEGELTAPTVIVNASNIVIGSDSSGKNLDAQKSNLNLVAATPSSPCGSCVTVVADQQLTPKPLPLFIEPQPSAQLLSVKPLEAPKAVNRDMLVNKSIVYYQSNEQDR
jgi:hypothetical protein